MTLSNVTVFLPSSGQNYSGIICQICMFFISDTFTPITTGEFNRRVRDISVFETKLDLYYETAQKHENEMKTLFERLNTDTNDVIKDFEVLRLKICLLLQFNQN